MVTPKSRAFWIANSDCRLYSTDRSGTAFHSAIRSPQLGSNLLLLFRQRCHIRSPSTKLRDVDGIFDGVGLAEETLNRMSIFELNRADPQRGADPGHEAAVSLDGHLPHLQLNLVAWLIDHAN